jgi:hypothetical protein
MNWNRVHAEDRTARAERQAKKEPEPVFIRPKHKALCVACEYPIQRGGRAYWHPKTKQMWHARCFEGNVRTNTAHVRPNMTLAQIRAERLLRQQLKALGATKARTGGRRAENQLKRLAALKEAEARGYVSRSQRQAPEGRTASSGA